MDWHALHDGDWYDMLDDEDFNATEAASVNNTDAYHHSQGDDLYRDFENNPMCGQSPMEI